MLEEFFQLRDGLVAFHEARLRGVEMQDRITGRAGDLWSGVGMRDADQMCVEEDKIGERKGESEARCRRCQWSGKR